MSLKHLILAGLNPKGIVNKVYISIYLQRKIESAKSKGLVEWKKNAFLLLLKIKMKQKIHLLYIFFFRSFTTMLSIV